MNKARPTNRDIVELVEAHVKTTQITLARMDERLHLMHESQKESNDKQLKGTSVLIWIAGAIASTVALTFTIIQAT